MAATTVRDALRPLKHLGVRHSCPMCGAHLRHFLPIGEDHPVLREMRVVAGGPRPDGFCPSCYSTDRVRHIYLYLRDETDVLTRPVDVLHIAPEPSLGPLLQNRPTGSYVSGDLEPGRAMVALDLTDTGMADASFDLIICNHVLEHIPDDLRAMREVARLLRPGGFAVLQAPIALASAETVEDVTVSDPVERQRRFGQDDHIRIYGYEDYPRRLRQAGLHVTTRNLTRERGEAYGRRFGLLADEDLFICTAGTNPPA